MINHIQKTTSAGIRTRNIMRNRLYVFLQSQPIKGPLCNWKSNLNSVNTCNINKANIQTHKYLSDVFLQVK